MNYWTTIGMLLGAVSPVFIKIGTEIDKNKNN